MMFFHIKFKLFSALKNLHNGSNVMTVFTKKEYVVLPKNSGNLNRAPEPVVVCPSATRCG